MSVLTLFLVNEASSLKLVNLLLYRQGAFLGTAVVCLEAVKTVGVF